MPWGCSHVLRQLRSVYRMCICPNNLLSLYFGWVLNSSLGKVKNFHLASQGLLTFPCPVTSTCESEVAQSCLTLCNPMDCSLPGSSVHGIFQARVLERVAISFSRGSSSPMDQIWVSHIVIARRHFTI